MQALLTGVRSPASVDVELPMKGVGVRDKKWASCPFCGDEAVNVVSVRHHLADCAFEPVREVAEDPLVVVLGWGTGMTPIMDIDPVGAALALADCVWELRRRWPGVRFQLMPLSVGGISTRFVPNERNTTALLAIAEPDREREAYRETIA